MAPGTPAVGTPRSSREDLHTNNDLRRTQWLWNRVSFEANPLKEVVEVAGTEDYVPQQPVEEGS